MPRKRPSVDDPRTQKAREEMILGPSAVDLEVHDFSVRVAGLPLFRRTENGDLSQALRLVVLAESAVGDVTFTVSDGDTTLDTARVRIDRGSTLVHLFVPEVYEPHTFSLRVEAGGREPFEAGVEILPQRKWSVFLVHHSHLDIGYTDTQSSVLQHHLQYLDSVLDLASATDDWPEDAKFRWNVEANWPLLHWIKSRPESDRTRFFDRVREGRIEVCALPFSMHTEAYSIDELARQLRFADELRDQYDRAHTDRHADRRARGDDRPSYFPGGRGYPLPFRSPQLCGPFCPASGRRAGSYASLLLARPQRQTSVGVVYGLAAR